MLGDAGLQIAATALCHDVELVTGNPRHCRRNHLLINDTLFVARQVSARP